MTEQEGWEKPTFGSIEVRPGKRGTTYRASWREDGRQRKSSFSSYEDALGFLNGLTVERPRRGRPRSEVPYPQLPSRAVPLSEPLDEPLSTFEVVVTFRVMARSADRAARTWYSEQPVAICAREARDEDR